MLNDAPVNVVNITWRSATMPLQGTFREGSCSSAPEAPFRDNTSPPVTADVGPIEPPRACACAGLKFGPTSIRAGAARGCYSTSIVAGSRCIAC